MFIPFPPLEDTVPPVRLLLDAEPTPIVVALAVPVTGLFLHPTDPPLPPSPPLLPPLSGDRPKKRGRGEKNVLVALECWLVLVLLEPVDPLERAAECMPMLLRELEAFAVVLGVASAVRGEIARPVEIAVILVLARLGTTEVRSDTTALRVCSHSPLSGPTL